MVKASTDINSRAATAITHRRTTDRLRIFSLVFTSRKALKSVEHLSRHQSRRPLQPAHPAIELVPSPLKSLRLMGQKTPDDRLDLAAKNAFVRPGEPRLAEKRGAAPKNLVVR